MKTKEKIYAIIPAAGQGTRMGSDKPNKQFLELRGIPVLIRTLRVFDGFPRIDGIIVAANPSEIGQIQDLCGQYHIHKLIGIAEGGNTRQDSVRNAIGFLAAHLSPQHSAPRNLMTQSPAPNDPLFFPGEHYVLIHDGARPFVTGEIIGRCIDGAIRYHACGAGVPVKDTIKQVRTDGVILHTPPREELWAIQTPQAFLLSLIGPLHERACRDGLSFTDDTAIAEYYGEEVRMVTGGYQNIKITTPEDLLYGEILLKDREDRK